MLVALALATLPGELGEESGGVLLGARPGSLALMELGVDLVPLCQGAQLALTLGIPARCFVQAGFELLDGDLFDDLEEGRPAGVWLGWGHDSRRVSRGATRLAALVR